MVFQPHRYSRTNDLYESFVSSLGKVDVLVLLNVYAAGEQLIAGADSRSLSRSIRQRGELEPIYVEDNKELLKVLESLLQPDDVLLMQGAGDVGKISKSLVSSASEALIND